MTNEPNHNKFLRDFMTCLVIALIMVILCIIFSSCSLFNKSQKTKETIKTDSTSVKKVTETSSKVDTSKTKSESTKETVYYPQPIIIPGTNGGEAKIIFVPQSTKETGKSETQNFNYDQWFKEKTDSMTIANLQLQLSKQSETKVGILPLGFWIGIGFVGLVAIGLMVMLLKMKSQFTSITNLLPKIQTT